MEFLIACNKISDHIEKRKIWSYNEVYLILKLDELRLKHLKIKKLILNIARF